LVAVAGSLLTTPSAHGKFRIWAWSRPAVDERHRSSLPTTSTQRFGSN
jgi:hypothetical protein